MNGRVTVHRLRRTWRLMRWEVVGAARSVRYDLGRLERPGHARGRVRVEWDGSERPYRRMFTALAFGVLLLGAISGSYYAAAGGLLSNDPPDRGTDPVSVSTSSPVPAPTPSTSSAPAVTVLPATPVPHPLSGTPTPTPHRSGTPTPPNPPPGCTGCQVPTDPPPTSPGTDPEPSTSDTGSPSPSPSESLSP